MDNFMKEAFDLKRFVLLSVRKIWMLFASIIMGSLLFGLFYFGKEVWLAGPDNYSREILYYITFDREQVADIHDYYNDFTWNDVLDSDQVAGRASAISGIPKEKIADAAEIPTMSDIRFIWVIVTDHSSTSVQKISDSITLALEEFAEETPGFTSIEVFDDEGISLVKKDVYLIRWFVFGAILGGVVGFLYLLYENALDDSMYVELDVEKRFGVRCMGVTYHGMKKEQFKNPSREYLELKGNLSYLLEKNKKIAFAESYENALGNSISKEFLEQMVEEVSKETGLPKVDVELVPYIRGKERDFFMEIRNADAIVWLVPFGKQDGTRLDRAWKNLQFWSCKVDAVILTDISKTYYRSYYFGQISRRKSKLENKEEIAEQK